MSTRLLFGFTFMLMLMSHSVLAQLRVVYPNVNEAGKELFGYAVLKLALENSGEDFELIVTDQVANNARIRRDILQGKISITDFGTSQQFEQELLAIYFPIDMGLNGWRVFLIHKDNLLKFKGVQKSPALANMLAGQGIGWSDVDILEHAGLKVHQAPHLSNLFKMLEKKRFDYLPLGANEIHSLLTQYQNLSPNVVVEPNNLLIYPFARFFFVHKSNRKLHDAVYRGLVAAFDNGSFWQLFKSHKSNAAIFNRANLANRQQKHIDNPHMTPAFRKIPKKYFFRLEMLD